MFDYIRKDTSKMQVSVENDSIASAKQTTEVGAVRLRVETAVVF
jgi:hypothetical protein